MKKFTQCLAITLLCVAVTGCGPQWKRKFVRKSAQKTPEQAYIYEQQEYRSEPAGVLYKNHFIFWRAWQEELVNKLGGNKVADLRSFEEALKHLGDMKSHLSPEKAAELDPYLSRIDALRNDYKADNYDVVRSRQMRDELNRIMLRIDKAFRSSRVKDYIR